MVVLEARLNQYGGLPVHKKAKTMLWHTGVRRLRRNAPGRKIVPAFGNRVSRRRSTRQYRTRVLAAPFSAVQMRIIFRTKVGKASQISAVRRVIVVSAVLQRQRFSPAISSSCVPNSPRHLQPKGAAAEKVKVDPPLSRRSITFC